MKIKLILSADEKDPLKGQNPFMPLSLLLLAESAPEHDYVLVDMLMDEHDFEDVSSIDLVGISVRMSAQEAAFALGDAYRDRGVKVIMGGPQASANPMGAKTHADVVVIGEGETLWPKVIQDIENGSPKDFYVSSPKKYTVEGYSVFQLDQLPALDKIPIPFRKKFKHKYTFDMVFAARGCPIACDFCSVSRLFGKNYRLRPVDEVVKDIAEIPNYYYLIDDTVFGRPNTYAYYTELYDKLAKQPKIKYWTGQANLDAAAHDKGKEVIRKAVDAGFLYAAIGMESINKEVLQKSGSYAKMGLNGAEDYLEKMKDNIRFLQSEGVLISAWFAIGYEDDDLETYYRTFEFCREMSIMPVFTPVHALDDTELYDRLKKSGGLQDRSTNLSNVKHPKMQNESVMKAMEYTVAKGYTLGAIMSRSLHYFRNLRRLGKDGVSAIIHKTIFSFMTQLKMRKITSRENAILRAKMTSQ